MIPAAEIFIAIVFVAFGVVLLAGAIIGRSARGQRLCRKCRYDMTGAVDLRCPECGKVAKSERRLVWRRRSKGRVLLAILCLLAPILVGMNAFARDEGWASFVPTGVLIGCVGRMNTMWALGELNGRDLDEEERLDLFWRTLHVDGEADALAFERARAVRQGQFGYSMRFSGRLEMLARALESRHAVARRNALELCRELIGFGTNEETIAAIGTACLEICRNGTDTERALALQTVARGRGVAHEDLLPLVKAGMRSDSAEVRSAALLCVGWNESMIELPKLRRMAFAMLDDPDASVVYTAVRVNVAICMRSDTRGAFFDKCLSMLNEPRGVESWCLWLGQLEALPEAICDALFSVARDHEDPVVRHRAMHHFAGSAVDSSRAVPMVVSMLRSKNSQWIQWAANTLEEAPELIHLVPESALVLIEHPSVLKSVRFSGRIEEIRRGASIPALRVQAVDARQYDWKTVSSGRSSLDSRGRVGRRRFALGTLNAIVQRTVLADLIDRKRLGGESEPGQPNFDTRLADVFDEPLHPDHAELTLGDLIMDRARLAALGDFTSSDDPVDDRRCAARTILSSPAARSGNRQSAMLVAIATLEAVSGFDWAAIINSTFHAHDAEPVTGYTLEGSSLVPVRTIEGGLSSVGAQCAGEWRLMSLDEERFLSGVIERPGRFMSLWSEESWAGERTLVLEGGGGGFHVLFAVQPEQGLGVSAMANARGDGVSEAVRAAARDGFEVIGSAEE